MLNDKQRKILSQLCDLLEQHEVISDMIDFGDDVESGKNRKYIWSTTGEDVGVTRIDNESVDFTDDD